MRAALGLCLLLGSLAATAVHAQPGPPAGKSDKGDAKSLLASGLRLFAAKDYLGALSVFQTAYAQFASAKILLNIGTTLVKLDRKAEAANAYQGYLDSPDVDAAKKIDVSKVLAGLDIEVGTLELHVTPADAEVQVGDGEWTAAGKLARMRVTPGSITVHARRLGWKPWEQTSSVAAGGTRSLALTLEAELVDTTGENGTITTSPGGLRTSVTPAQPPSRLGLLVLAHIDPTNKGGAALVGLAFDVAHRLQLQAAALLGPVAGGYVGASIAIMSGRVRPILVAGVPIFVSNGARVSSRVAAGAEVVFNRHLALVAELGVEHVWNPEAGIAATMFVPAIGLVGRL